MEKSPVPSPTKARANPRSRDTLLVSYTISPDIAREYTETYDIALGGLAMLTNARLTPNSHITIELELRDGTSRNLLLDGNVRWSTYDALVEKYRTGVSFTDRTDDDERTLLRYIDMLHSLRNVGAR